MAKNIEPKLMKIGEYLKLDEGTLFMIPEYQRAYSWRAEHCDKLWQDIVDYIANYDVSESRDRYFFGTIIINCQNDDTQFSLIDGQQRTTTFLLLLKALLMKVNTAIGQTKNDADSAKLFRNLKLERNFIMQILYKADQAIIPDEADQKEDREIFTQNVVLENHSINESYKTELNTILQAYDYAEAERNVVRIPYRQKDNKFTNFFRNFKFFYEKASELSVSELNSFVKAVLDQCEVIEIRSWQVEQAITMFNSLNSDGLPLYDSDIISAQLYAEAEKSGQREQYAALWKELLEQIGELSSMGVANIDSILMQHMYYIRAKNKEIVSETGAINVTMPGLRRYYIENNKEIIKKPVFLCEQLSNLTRIWKKVLNYPLVQVLFRFSANSKLFLASYFYRFKVDDISEEKIKTVLECLLRLFTILELVDMGYSSSYFKTFLFGEEVKLTNSTISEEEIKMDFDKHIAEKWTRDSIKELIMAYDKNILVFINEYLFAAENGMNFSLSIRHDIEHIMPSSGKNQQEIRVDAEIDNEDEFYEYVNKLGNKILLEENINRSIGNEWFRTKVSTRLVDKTGYIDSYFPLAKALVQKYKETEKPYWKKDDIIRTTEEAAERIVRFIFDEKDE